MKKSTDGLHEYESYWHCSVCGNAPAKQPRLVCGDCIKPFPADEDGNDWHYPESDFAGLPMEGSSDGAVSAGSILADNHGRGGANNISGLVRRLRKIATVIGDASYRYEGAVVLEAADALERLDGQDRAVDSVDGISVGGAGGSKQPDDLVKRLRKGRSANEWVSEELAHEAADALERMADDNAQLKKAVERNYSLKDATIAGLGDANRLYQATIERLKDENANLRALLPYHEYQGQDSN